MTRTTETVTVTHSQAGPDQHVGRVAELWKKHLQEHPELANANFLTASAAYRQWSKSTDLKLPFGEEIPPYTQLLVHPTTKTA